MKSKPPHIVVIRCSLLDGVDPIVEIDALLKTKKLAWFGKYGQPLGEQIKATIESREREVYALLIRKSRDEEGGQYVFKVYRVHDLLRDRSPSSGHYPKYYQPFLNRIRSWVLLSEYDGVPIMLDDITTRKSGLPLRHSLSQSMRGHFNAILRIRQHV